jgi:diguanylate cyclase (GGDEF)-like protein
MSHSDEDLEKTSVVTSETLKVTLDTANKAPAALVLLVGPASSIGKQWHLSSTDVVVGRSPSSSVFVDDRSVSKSHAKFILNGNDVLIMDLESTNKTVINQQTVAPLTPVKLVNNDQIKVGNVIFKFLEKGNVETVASKATFDKTQLDGMTGIYSKGALQAYAPEAIKRSDMTGEPLSLIVFDIDHFKKVNDTHGHAAGDYVIKEIARLVKDKLIRSEDFFARFGGEEFVLVVSSSDIPVSANIAERIRATIEAHNFDFEGIRMPITVSAGVSVRKTKGDGWDRLFEKADKALYQSKNRGRNLVSIEGK